MAIIEENYINFAEHSETLLSNLHQLYSCNMFVDMCMVCHGCEIFAHKAVIAAASPILRDRINEFGDCHARIEVELTVNGVEINIEDIKYLLEFIYKGQVWVPEARLSLFLEVGNHLQVFGLYNSNTNSQLPFLSQPASNYNISQHSLPNLNFNNLQYHENSNFDDPCASQVDSLCPTFPNFFSPNCLLSPDKLSDSLIKQDKSTSVPVSNTSFSDLCSGIPAIESYLMRDKTLTTDTLNPKDHCDFTNYTSNETSIQDINELSIISNTSYPSDLSENSINVQSENSKDVFINQSALPCNLPEPVFFSNLSTQPTSYFNSEVNLVEENDSENCIPDIDFQPCKIPVSSSLPERQMRLKVKDSIGGVSLQDTSQGDKASQRGSPGVQEISEAIDSCQPFQEQIDNTSGHDDSIEAIEFELDHLCSHCQQHFSSQNDLAAHLYEEHKIGTLHKCLLCTFETHVENNLVEHGKTHLGNVDRQCCICGKRFKTRATLRNHLTCHATSKLFTCKECKANYSQRSNLINHLASEHHLDVEGAPIKEQLSCTLCSFVTWAPHKLKNHKVRCHTEDKPFKCTECSYSATERMSLIKHVRTHTQERPYICDICGLSFVTVSSLKRHCRGHTKEKPFKCKECGQQYADKKRLNDHLLKHKSIKPYKCSFCEYLCRRKDNLQSHIKRNHANSTSKEVNNGESQEMVSQR